MRLAEHIVETLTRAGLAGALHVTLGHHLTESPEELTTELEESGHHLPRGASTILGIPDVYTVISRTGSTHAWWAPDLTREQLEVYNRLRADGTPAREARGLAETLT